MNKFIRAQAMLGDANFEKVKNSTIAVFGLGGVGGYVFEGLVRLGVENILIVDYDIIDETNINRQIIANKKTIGNKKVDEYKKRAIKINEKCNIYKFCININSIEDLEFLNNYKLDYIIDAIDGFEGKISLIKYANIKNIPIISSMGTGNKLHPEYFEIEDIYSTQTCPLAKKIRKRLRKENIKSLNVVYSKEKPIKHEMNFIGSVSFVPPVAGFIMVGKVVRDLCKYNESKF